MLDRHPNHVRLFYCKDDQGLARVTPKQLLECCLRMKPDRILLAELRAEEAFDYLRNVNSGPSRVDHQRARHERRAGLRAAGAAGQAERRRTRAWRARDIKSLLYLLIDVVIQFGLERHQRVIKEIWYRARRASAAQRAARRALARGPGRASRHRRSDCTAGRDSLALTPPCRGRCMAGLVRARAPLRESAALAAWSPRR